MKALTASAAPLRIIVPFEVDAAHPGRGAEGDELVLAELALAQAELLLREHDDRAALGRLVGERRELRDLGKLPLVDARCRDELRRLPVPERDRAGLVEQQHVDVAGRLDGAARHREHVPLHEPIHPGDPDRRQQGADRRGDQRHEERDQHGLGELRAGVDPVRAQRHDGGDEGDRQAGEEDVEGDLVRRLAPLGALDERDHPVEERLARLLRHLDHEPVGEELRAAGDGRAVAAGLADDRRGLAGDRGLVDRAGALDRCRRRRGSIIPASTTTTSPFCRSGAAISSRCPSWERRSAVVVVRVARSAFACALPRPSAIASAKFANRTVSQSQIAITPTNQSWLVFPCDEVLEEDHGRDHAAELDDEHHRVAQLQARVELRERVADGGEHEVAREHAGRAAGHQLRCSLSSARLRSRTFTPGSPKKPSWRPTVCCSIRLCTVASGRCRTAATRRACRFA